MAPGQPVSRVVSASCARLAAKRCNLLKLRGILQIQRHYRSASCAGLPGGAPAAGAADGRGSDRISGRPSDAGVSAPLLRASTYHLRRAPRARRSARKPRAGGAPSPRPRLQRPQARSRAVRGRAVGALPPTRAFAALPPTRAFAARPPTRAFAALPPTRAFTALPPTRAFTALPPARAFTARPTSPDFTNPPTSPLPRRRIAMRPPGEHP